MNQELEKEFDKRFWNGLFSHGNINEFEYVKSFIDTHFISRKDLLKTINIEYFCDNCHKPLSGKIGGNGNFYSVKGWYQSGNINGRIASWCNKKCEKNYFPNLISRKEVEQMIEEIDEIDEWKDYEDGCDPNPSDAFSQGAGSFKEQLLPILLSALKKRINE